MDAGTPMTFRAHSRSPKGHEDPVAAHLQAVSRRAALFAESFGAGEEAAIAGLLHDLGKYGDLFQRRLEGLASGVDHWSLGAWACIQAYRRAGQAAALAIQGHHVGLQVACRDNFRSLAPERLAENCPEGRRPSAPDTEPLLARAAADGLDLPPALAQSVFEDGPASPAAALMLDVRMLFSALVDADFLETEAHFQATGPDVPHYRAPGPELLAAAAEECLDRHLRRVREGSGAADHIRQLRDDLMGACLAAAETPPGLFTLTAPTGAGKTLSMLAFALRHARIHDLRRVVVVLPFLSIIDQTAGVYRDALRDLVAGAPEYVIEDHSLARAPDRDPDSPEGRARLLAENWDAPIVITTSVQMLESLFSNRPSRCRKLHRLARSVILFDEVQTLPRELAVSTLATLSRLSQRYGASVVFSTATQPAFEHLHESVRRYCAQGWRPREIVPEGLRLFDRARRTIVHWPPGRERRPWAELADELSAHPQVLCVVNLKRHALTLFDELRARDPEGLFHLSTSMCPAHRRARLDEIRERLDQGEPCRLVSTQCVEAGVDLDFPVAYRALAPLDAIAQAAGRCNREGGASIGEVHVFVPDEDRLYPGAAYRQAAGVTEKLMVEGDLDLHEPASFERYFRLLYDLGDLGRADTELIEAMRARNFERVAQHYHLIDRGTINVLVPYCRATFNALAEEVLAEGISRQWVAAAREHAVGIYRPRDEDPLFDLLEPVPVVPGREYADDWWIYRGDHYYEERGLVPSETDCIIA